MRLAIVSDSHGELPAALCERLAALEPLDRILHLGDLGPPALLGELAAFAPTLAVMGNTDRPGHPELPPRRQLTVAGLPIHLRHEPWSPAELPGGDELAALYLHGHIHRPRLERHGRAWICCPGSLVRPRGCEASYAFLELDERRLALSLHALADGARLLREVWPRG